MSSVDIVFWVYDAGWGLLDVPTTVIKSYNILMSAVVRPYMRCIHGNLLVCIGVYISKVICKWKKTDACVTIVSTEAKKNANGSMENRTCVSQNN